MAHNNTTKRVATTISEELDYRFRKLKLDKLDRSKPLTESLDEAFSDWLDKIEAAEAPAEETSCASSAA